MVRELMHDPLFLSRKSETATKADLQIAQDLLDTLTAHKDTCVGMAANMIGHCVCVMRRRKGAYPYWAAPGKPNDTRKSRCATKRRIFR